MSDISKKVLVSIIKEKGPSSLLDLRRKYNKVRKAEVTLSDIRDAVKELAGGEEPKLVVIQYQQPSDEKFGWTIFLAGTEFIFPQVEEDPEAVDGDKALDALVSQQADADPRELAASLFEGFFIVAKDEASYVTSAVQAQANAIKAIGDLGEDKVRVFGAVPVQLRIAAFEAISNGPVFADEEEDGEGSDLSTVTDVQPKGESATAPATTEAAAAAADAAADAAA